MNTKRNTKWHSCRLTTQNESGRLRWCVGQEKTWEIKLKRLVFLPAVLLTITLLCFIITHFIVPQKQSQSESTITLKGAEDLEHVGERNGFEETETSFLPTRDRDITFALNKLRQPRGIQIYASPFNNKNINLTKVDFFGVNDTEFTEYFNTQQNDQVSWRVPVKKTVTYPGSLDIEQDKKIPSDDYDLLEIHDEDTFSMWNNSLTPEQVRTYQAQNMLKYMDNNTKPCNDFYRYACGNWEKYHPIPADHIGYDTFEMLRENLDHYLRELLENEDREPFIMKEQLLQELEVNKRKREIFEMFSLSRNNSSVLYFENLLNNSTSTETLDPIVKTKFLYKSCMNEDLIRRRGVTPLLNLLSHLGHWPIIKDTWDENSFDFIWLLAQLRLYNNDILISEWVGPDIKNSNEYVIQIDQTSFGLPTREYFLDENNKKYVEAYQNFLLEVALILGADLDRAVEDIENIIDFEIELARIAANPEERRNLSSIYRKLTLGELQDLVPEMDWIRYFDLVSERNLPLSSPIVCYCINYLTDMVNLLKQTESRTVANYLLWRFVRHRVNNLDETFQAAKQKFYYVLFGREKLPPRWQFCVAQVNSNLGMALGNLFVSNYFDEKSKNDTIIMTKELQDTFRDILLNCEWLDNFTKAVAISKINAMRLRIGYPNLILDKELLTASYFDIKIHPDYYFENCLSILRHLTRNEHLKIGRTVNKNLWNTVPAIVNAYYSRNKNQIMFPAGILQPPFYHQFFPRALNYGGIGVVIGHEITHGFDDKGRLFDETGNLNSWWSEQATEQFHKKSKCLIDQYNSFIVPEVNVSLDGLTTQGENIADNGGMKQAYNAYVKWLQTHKDFQLPQLNMTNRQLFFLNFAQVWCGNSRPEATRNRLKTAVHSPGRFRVLGTLRNSYDFADVFKCTLGSPMNPVDKCRIW